MIPLVLFYCGIIILTSAAIWLLVVGGLFTLTQPRETRRAQLTLMVYDWLSVSAVGSILVIVSYAITAA